MKIGLGSDHRGAEAVRHLAQHLVTHGHTVCTLGPTGEESCDYPDGAYLVAHAVRRGDVDVGMLVCGSGIGMSIAANKVDGVRAALAFDERAAEMTRRHNDANVLCMAGDRASLEEICAMADVFITTDFEGGRHQRRVSKIAMIEKGVDPAVG